MGTIPNISPCQTLKCFAGVGTYVQPVLAQGHPFGNIGLPLGLKKWTGNCCRSPLGSFTHLRLLGTSGLTRWAWLNY